MLNDSQKEIDITTGVLRVDSENLESRYGHYEDKDKQDTQVIPENLQSWFLQQRADANFGISA
jgi:hypothetical protein